MLIATRFLARLRLVEGSDAGNADPLNKRGGVLLPGHGRPPGLQLGKPPARIEPIGLGDRFLQFPLRSPPAAEEMGQEADDQPAQQQQTREQPTVPTEIPALGCGWCSGRRFNHRCDRGRG